MTLDSPDLTDENNEKSRTLASALFSREEWVYRETGIWVAKSRLSEE
jgi:hypothetical protein